MTSTPSRSRASTKMSRPNIKGPTFPLWAELASEVFFALADGAVLLITVLGSVAGRPQVTKKPTTVASRGFLSKSFPSSTSTNGAAYYDDQQVYLSNMTNHGADVSP